MLCVLSCARLVMGLAGLGNKNNCEGEGQHNFTRPDRLREQSDSKIWSWAPWDSQPPPLWCPNIYFLLRIGICDWTSYAAPNGKIIMNCGLYGRFRCVLQALS
jgi:hypothetical protein